MDTAQLNWITNFIWGIADDTLRDVFVRGKYRDVILPMTVLRRLDAVLEPTKEAVLEMKAALDREKITNQDDALRSASGQAFYNTSPFLLRDLKSRKTQQTLKDDFIAYLESQVTDPAKRDKLIPDYEVGCKRNVNSDTYLAALDRPDGLRWYVQGFQECHDGRGHSDKRTKNVSV